LRNIYFLPLAFLYLITLNIAAQTLLINEFQTRNTGTITDNFKEYDDWIEIANISNQDLNLNGYYITDDIIGKSKFRISANGNECIIPPGGYLILWADDDITQGNDHLNFNNAVSLTISPSQPQDEVYYAINNTTPTIKSWLYKDALIIGQTEVINATDIKSGFINSNMTSQVYILRPAFTLPVIAVLTDSLNLFGPKGIYTNYNESWEKFSRINYISNEALTAESNAGIRIQGASSTFMPKKGFRLFFRSDYGNTKFEYPVFGVGYTASFKKLVLKPGYDDDITTTGGMKQLSSWVILYLNNQYWGIYNLRESIDENFITAHTNLGDFDLVRFLNEGPELVYGSLINWNKMYDLVKNTELSSPENYQTLAEILDIDAMVNLMAFVQCTVYYSWGWGISMFRENSPSARWNVSIWDADREFNNSISKILEPTRDLFDLSLYPAGIYYFVLSGVQTSTTLSIIKK
jgi:hypothetical protein